MKVNKEDLRKALEVVKPGLATKEIIMQSTSFAFMDNRVVTYNDEISISHPVEGLDIQGAIKAEELYQLLSRLKKEEIEIKLTKKEVILRAGRVKAGIKLQTKIKLPLEEIGDTGKWKTLPENFIQGLKFVLPTCSTNMNDPLLICVHASSEYVESSDGLRITRFTLEKKLPINEFLIPATSVRELIKLSPVKIAQGNGWVHFKTESGATISCRIFEDEYPAIDHHLKVKGVKIVFPKIIAKMLERVSVFSKRDVMTDESVSIEIVEGIIKIKGESDSGWITESAKIDYDDLHIKFNITPSLLREILESTNKCILGDDKIKFKSANWQFIALLRNN